MSAEVTASSSLSGDSRRRSSKSKTVRAPTSGGFSGASREIWSWRNYGEQKGHRKRGGGGKPVLRKTGRNRVTLPLQPCV